MTLKISTREMTNFEKYTSLSRALSKQHLPQLAGVFGAFLPSSISQILCHCPILWIKVR
jgi:hypothetical protein